MLTRSKHGPIPVYSNAHMCHVDQNLSIKIGRWLWTFQQTKANIIWRNEFICMKIIPWILIKNFSFRRIFLSCLTQSGTMSYPRVFVKSWDHTIPSTSIVEKVQCLAKRTAAGGRVMCKDFRFWACTPWNVDRTDQTHYKALSLWSA